LALKEIHTFLEMPGVPLPISLSQNIPFSFGLGFSFGKFEDIPEVFLKRNFFNKGSFVDLNHLRDEETVFFDPSIHMPQKAPFHL